MNFNYCNTTKVFFSNEINDLKNIVETDKYKKVLVITGEKNTLSIANEIVRNLNATCLVLPGITTNPLSETIEQMAIKAKEFYPDLIITVGGGSVHDAGKAVAVLYYDTNHTAEDFTVNGSLSVSGIKKVLPIITVPTLFGSGAEVSPAALIRINNEKRVIFSPLLHPIATFVNTKYAESLSTKQIARSSFDSFIQALEGFISLSANNISDAFAHTVLELFNNCYAAIIDGNYTVDIFEKLAVASIFSSYVCSTSSVGAIHAISDPISGRYNVHHGEALALVALPVLEKNLSVVNKSRVIQLDSFLENIPSFETDCVGRVLDKVSTIIQKCGLATSFNYCVTDDVLDSMAKESINPDMAGNPYDFSTDDIFSVLRKVFHA